MTKIRVRSARRKTQVSRVKIRSIMSRLFVEAHPAAFPKKEQRRSRQTGI